MSHSDLIQCLAMSHQVFITGFTNLLQRIYGLNSFEGQTWTNLELIIKEQIQDLEGLLYPIIFFQLDKYFVF